MQEVVICEHARDKELREKGVVRVLATSLVTEGQRERRVEGEKDWQRQRESMFEFCVFIIATELLRACSDKAPPNKICRRAPLA